MKIKLIFLQILLCTLLLAFCVIIRCVYKDTAVAAGTFGKPKPQNLTFEDYIYNKYGDLF